MKKLIIHISKDCAFNQSEQLLSACFQLNEYFKHKGDKDTRITAYWSRQNESDVLIICHDKSDMCVFSWDNKI